MKPLHLDHVVQDRWHAGFILHVGGIAFGDGRVTLVSAKKNISGPSIKVAIGRRSETTASAVLESDPMAWVVVTSLATLAWSPEIQVECGEGAMGNEGYIAVTDSRNGALIWSFFCSASNPFVEVRRDGDTIVAEGGYDLLWQIPLDDPEEMSVETFSGWPSDPIRP